MSKSSRSQVVFFRTFLAGVAVAALPLAWMPASANVLLRGGLGPSLVSGEVGDNLSGNGITLNGEIFVGVSPSIYLGGGLGLGIMSGCTPVSDSAASIVFEVGGLIFPAGKPGVGSPAFYLGGTVGRGGLGWNYTLMAERFFGTRNDAIGFFHISPRAGVLFQLSTMVALAGEGRWVLPRFDNSTTEGYLWDLDGGTQGQILGFLQLTL